MLSVGQANGKVCVTSIRSLLGDATAEHLNREYSESSVKMALAVQ